MVVLGSQQVGTLKLGNPKQEDWASIHLLTLSVLFFLVTLPRCQVVFQWKQTKEKLGNALTLSWRRPLSYRNQSIDWFLYDNGLRHERAKCAKEFSRRFDLPNGKSIFLRVFAIIVKATNLKTKDIAWIFLPKLSHA